MCCSGNKRAIRSSSSVSRQSADKPAKTPTVRKVVRNNQSQPAPISRQYVIKRQECPKCGHPTMLVHIANRERQQCTNLDCRFIIQ